MRLGLPTNQFLCTSGTLMFWSESPRCASRMRQPAERSPVGLRRSGSRGWKRCGATHSCRTPCCRPITSEWRRGAGGLRYLASLRINCARIVGQPREKSASLGERRSNAEGAAFHEHLWLRACFRIRCGARDLHVRRRRRGVPLSRILSDVYADTGLWSRRVETDDRLHSRRSRQSRDSLDGRRVSLEEISDHLAL
jgi:hypothetical protein